MKPIRKLSVSLLSGMAALAMLSVAAAAPPGPARDKNVTVTVVDGAGLINRQSGAAQPMTLRSQQMSLTSYSAAPHVDAQDIDDWSHSGVPLWIYHVRNAPRDG